MLKPVREGFVLGFFLLDGKIARIFFDVVFDSPQGREARSFHMLDGCSFQEIRPLMHGFDPLLHKITMEKIQSLVRIRGRVVDHVAIFQDVPAWNVACVGLSTRNGHFDSLHQLRRCIFIAIQRQNPRLRCMFEPDISRSGEIREGSALCSGFALRNHHCTRIFCDLDRGIGTATINDKDLCRIFHARKCLRKCLRRIKCEDVHADG